MTSETANLTEPWVKQHGMEYAYGYEGGKLFSATGGNGLPHAVLLDPQGTIVWSGHPAGLTADVVRPALAGALKVPVFDWPESAVKVRKAFKKGDMKGAVAAADELGEDGTLVREALKTVIAGRLAALEKAHGEKDWLAVDRRGKRLSEEFAGLPEFEKVSSLLASLDDKEAKTVLKAQEKIEALFAERIKKRDLEKHQKMLRKIIDDLPGTAAARDADRAIDTLIAMFKERD